MLRRMAIGTGLFLLLLIGVKPVQAQTGKVAGTVTDLQTGEPIAGAQVMLEGTGRGALTQANGRYFILNVPTGTYTIVAQSLGYATIRRENVLVTVDVTRTMDFALPTQAIAQQAIVVQAERTPLVQVNATGSTTTITSDQLLALPVNDVRGALALQPGFLDLQLENEDAVSYVDSRRGFSPIRIRGGRYGETASLVDGIPVSNILFGGPAFDVPSMAVEQVTLETGGFEAQYGNALSGIINTSTREGSKNLRGSLRYSTSRAAGALGARQDELRGFDGIEGYISGPVPGTNEKLRYLFSGQYNDAANRVLEYDDHVFDPSRTTRDANNNRAHQFDLIEGWRAYGFTQGRDLYGKLTYYFTPTAKLNVGALGSHRESQPFDQMFQFLGVDLAAVCRERYPSEAGWCENYFGSSNVSRLEEILPGNLARFPNNLYGVQNAVTTDRNLVWGKWDHTLGRFAYSAVLGRFSTERLSCNWLSGVCLEDKIRTLTTIGPITTTQFTPQSRHGAAFTGPATGTENFFGSDSTRSWVARADVQAQVNENHNIKAGIFYQKHGLYMNESRSLAWPFDRFILARYDYQSEPYDAAVYVQDKMEWDFLTVNVGVRFDYGRADGLFFTDPLDPTNGTTAFEVCEGRAPSLGHTEAWTLQGDDGQALPFQGIAACSTSEVLMDSARAIAFQDDFSEAPVRKTLSPRIGFSFPVTTNSRIFANYGQYSQLPTYNAMFSKTGIGRLALDSTSTLVRRGDEVTREIIAPGGSVEGTPLGPDLRSYYRQSALIGNPRLENETTALYEMGFNAELLENYGLQAVAYYKDQSGLTGIRSGGVRPSGERVNDPGETYGSTSPQYRVLINSDYQTVRGFDVAFRRRVVNFWGFDLRYGYMQAWTNAAPPELELQRIYENEREAFNEFRSEADRPHVLTGVLRLSAREETPDLPLGEWLRNSTIAVTSTISSGLPYTPTVDIRGRQRRERNTGRAPTTFTTNLQATKDFRIANLKYGAFLRVTNLFDTKNCVFVYSSTGRCDSGSIAMTRVLPSASPGTEPAFFETGYLSTMWDRPQMIAGRRHITAGLQMSF